MTLHRPSARASSWRSPSWRSFSWRRLVGLAAALVAVPLALSGCSGAPGPAVSPDAAGAAAGPWTFTDDLGTTITLEQRPTRIAGYNDVLGALLAYGIEPVASFGFSSVAADSRFEGLDTDGITEVGTTYGTINLEKLASLQPDLIVVNAYPSSTDGVVNEKEPLYGFKDLAQQQQVAAIAPIAVITMGGSAKTVIERTTELAVGLGAKQATVDAAKARFDAAAVKLGEAGKLGVTVESIYADADALYVNKPNDDPTLRMYAEFGLNLVQPAGADSNYYWRILTWEEADQVTGDVLLYSQRGYGPAELAKRPTFANLPAVQAKRLYASDFTSMDYDSQARAMARIASLVTQAA